MGGGLVRSLGGWSKVASLRQHGATEKGDERILGSSEFVMTILREAEEKQCRQVKVGPAGNTMPHLIDEECRGRQINPHEVRSGGRRTKASEARAVIAYRATTEFGLPAAEIARHLSSCNVARDTPSDQYSITVGNPGRSGSSDLLFFLAASWGR